MEDRADRLNDSASGHPFAGSRPQVRRRAWVIDIATVTLAAWLSSAPLTAYFFGRISPGGLFANMAITPLAFLVVLTGGLSLLSGLIWSGFGITFNHANLALCWLMEWCARTVAAIPGASLVVPRPPGWAVPLILMAIWRCAVMIPPADTTN